MSLVDTAVVGRLGALEVGAAGLANGLFFSVTVIGLGAMLGLDPLISQAIGASDLSRARVLYWQGLFLAIFVSLGLLPLLLLAPLILEPFGIDREVAQAAGGYLVVRCTGLLPFLLFLGARSFLQAHKRTSPLVFGVVVANVLNLIIDPLFVFGWGPIPAFGMDGAAIVTTLCTLLQWLVAAHAAHQLLGRSTPEDRKPRLDDQLRIFKLGLPIGLQYGAEIGLFTLAGLLAGKLGKVELAAHQVALQICSLTFAVALGISAAASTRVGLFVGAGDSAGARRAGMASYKLVALISVVWTLLFILLPGPIARLITPTAEVIALAGPILLVGAAFQLADGVQAVGAGVLRGTGETRFAFLANLAGHYAVGLPVSVVCGLWLSLGVIGIWMGLAAGLAVVALALFLRFNRISARPIRALEAHR